MASWEQQIAAAARAVDRRGTDTARAYWDLGRLLAQLTGPRAPYGTARMEELATRFNVLPRTLYRARRFYQRLPNLTTWSDLSWSHCRLLVTVDDDERLLRLAQQTRDEGWSVRRLRQEIGRAGAAEPIRGRPSTYRLLPDPARLDLGFGLSVCLDALGRLTDRARRLADTDHPLLVEWVPQNEHVDLRPVWGIPADRLHTYSVTALDIGTGTGREPALTATLQLCPGHRLQTPLVVRGVAGAEAHRLTVWLETHTLVAHIDRPGPPPVADLFGLSGMQSAAAAAQAGEPAPTWLAGTSAG